MQLHAIFPAALPTRSSVDYINVGNPATVIGPEVYMPLDNRGCPIGTDVRVGKIEGQELVCSASYTLQVFALVLHHSVGMRVREIFGFTAVHGSHISS